MLFNSLQELVSLINKKFAQNITAEIVGNPTNLSISKVNDLDNATENSLCFALDNAQTDKVIACKAGAIVASPKFRDILIEKNLPALITKDVYLLFAKASTLFYNQPLPVSTEQTEAQKKLAHIASEINADISVGAFTIIEQNVQIGSNSKIGSQCWIGENVKIGKNCYIYANVSLYPNTVIGNNVIIHSGVVLGADGYGFTPQKTAGQQTWFKIPQHGKVIINDDVEIGANSSVDRGALKDTIIGKGVKIDNLVQVGHGAEVGEHTLLMGYSAISGSVKIGENCLIGGQVGLGPGITIADNVTIHPQAFVVHSVLESGQYSGAWPLQKHRDWLRTQVKLLKRN